MKKTTKLQFAQFKDEFNRVVEVLGLKGWKIYFEYEDIRSIEGYASLSWDLEGMVATVTMTSILDDDHVADFNPTHVGRHEALHLLIASLVSLARWRFVTPDQIDVAQEAIVRRLEKLLIEEAE